MTLASRFKRKPAEPATAGAAPLAARAIHKNLLLTDDGVWAWYRLDSVPWSFKSSDERAGILDSATIRWADLAGFRVHLRRTAHPVPYSVWAQRLDRATPAPLETDDPDALTWQDFITGAQVQIAESRMENPTSYIGVQITTKRLRAEDLPKIKAAADSTVQTIAKVRETLAQVNRTIAKDGFRGKPMSSRALGWLIHASTGLGVPVAVTSLAGDPDTWHETDMEHFTTPVHAFANPLDKTVQVTALRDGTEYHRWIACLSVGRMQDRDTENPAYDPWMSHTDRLPFPVEWTATFDVVGPERARSEATFIRRRAEDVERGYLEHDETPPPSVARGIRDASRIEDEVTDGDREVAVRLAGPIRCAVSAHTEAEALARVSTLTDTYAMNQRISLHHGYGQYALYREFIPGERASTVGFQRIMPGYYAATAVPNASTQLGDGEGPYLGRTGHRAVFFDPTWGPRHNTSGMVLVGGGLGSGKTTLAGVLADASVRRGHRTIIMDPSGPLARMCHMPGIREHAKHVELSGAEPGTLNPYLLVPDPQQREFRDNERAYHEARREAEAERKDLAADALVMLLPPQIVEHQEGAVAAIEKAVNLVGGDYGTNPWRVVRALEEGDAYAQSLGASLRAVARMKGASLVFPEDEDARAVDARTLSDALLTVITMRGITTPPIGTPRSEWTRAERMAAAVLHLAARYAMRAMYADQDPKTILTDETGIIAAGASSFRSFLLRGSRDSRKCNAMFGILSQNPGDLLRLESEIVNLVGAAFIGRINDDDTATAALKILGVPTGHGYEKALRHLETGEFLFRDWRSNVDRLDVDLAHRPDLLAVLDTTPKTVMKEGTEPESWADELVTA